MTDRLLTRSLESLRLLRADALEFEAAHAESLAMVGNAALSDGLPTNRGSSPLLPLANTTMPPRLTTKSFQALANSRLSAGSLKYNKPQELLIILAPALAS